MNILPDSFALHTLLSSWSFLSPSFEVSGRYSAHGVHEENNPEGVQRPQPQIHPQQLLLILDGLNLRCVGVLSHFELPVPPSAHCLNSSFISSTKSEALGPAGEVSHFFFSMTFTFLFSVPPCPVQTQFRISLCTYCPSSVV